MISSLTLAYINLRLQGIFGGSKCFGSRNVLNHLQLPLVKGEPVLQKFPEKMLPKFSKGFCSL